MDQNYQNYQPYQSQPVYTPPVVKNAAYFRAKARAALKNCYWYALLAFLVASLLGGVAAGGSVSAPNFNTSGDFSWEETTLPELPFLPDQEEMLPLLEKGDFAGFFAEFSSEPIFIVLVVICIAGVLFGIAFSLFVSSPIRLGYQKYQLNVMDGNGKDLSPLFGFFKQGYGKSVLLNLAYSLLMFALSIPMMAVGFGWFLPSFLALIPDMLQNAEPNTGMLLSFLFSALVFFAISVATAIVSIVIEFRYAFVFMSMADDPTIGVREAFARSAALMKGNKWRLFCLQFSFFGWILLAAFCTCGLGVTFLAPYMYAAEAAFYDDISGRAAKREEPVIEASAEDYTPGVTL